MQIPRSARVFLTGFMGSGKSTIGPELAAVLGMSFADLDECIMQRTGLTIERIFAERGQKWFRAEEAAVLRTTAPGWVLALGGGTLVESPNLRWALSHGVVVYIRVPEAELCRRLEQDPAPRPLLMDKGGHRLTPVLMREKVRTMLAQRAASYEEAHLTIDGCLPPVTCAQQVADAINIYWERSRKERR